MSSFYSAILTNPLNNLFNAIDIPEEIWKASRKFDAVYQDAVSYPPYNIFKSSEDTFKIEIAVAGFKNNELEVIKEGTNLFVSGNPTAETEDVIQWIRRKLAKRSFKLSFTLGEDVNLINACLEDGILSIALKREIPEEKKPVKINILTNKDEIKKLVDEYYRSREEKLDKNSNKLINKDKVEVEIE